MVDPRRRGQTGTDRHEHSTHQLSAVRSKPAARCSPRRALVSQGGGWRRAPCPVPVSGPAGGRGRQEAGRGSAPGRGVGRDSAAGRGGARGRGCRPRSTSRQWRCCGSASWVFWESSCRAHVPLGHLGALKASATEISCRHPGVPPATLYTCLRRPRTLYMLSTDSAASTLHSFQVRPPLRPRGGRAVHCRVPSSVAPAQGHRPCAEGSPVAHSIEALRGMSRSVPLACPSMSPSSRQTPCHGRRHARQTS